MYTGLMDNSHSLVGYMFVLSTKGVCEDMYVKCANGNTEDSQKWWVENSGKPVDETSEMSCFEPTESSMMLDNIISKVDELSNILNK
jgi:hypothetical protein